MSRNRNFRRHVDQVAKTRACRILSFIVAQERLTAAGIDCTATPPPGSCYGCGNPRRKLKGVWRLTRQERRAVPAALD
jgi:hypothetical protein